MLAIGLMSGTSLDDVDTVLCEISGSLDQLDLKQLDFMTYPIEKDVKDRIRKVIQGDNISTQLICSLNFDANFPKSSYSAPPNWCLKYA